MDGAELFARLEPQPLNVRVVRVRRDAPPLELFKLLDLRRLAADVALVLDGDLHLLAHRRVQRRGVRIEGAQIVVAYLRPAQQVDQAAAVVYRRRAAALEHRVEFIAPVDARAREAGNLAAHGGVFLLHAAHPLVRDEPDPVPDGAQARVRVVLPQEQAVLRPARHDPVRLLRPLRDEVVDECADVALAAL